MKLSLLVVAAHGAKVQLHQQASSSKMADLASSAAQVLKQVAVKPGDVEEQQQNAADRKSDVQVFTGETLAESKIVTQAIIDEHNADVLTLKNQMQAIQDVIAEFHLKGMDISKKRMLEVQLMDEHLSCRGVQKGNCTNEKYTNEQLRIHERNMSKWEETTQDEEYEIKKSMCVQVDVDKWITQTVIELSGKYTVFTDFEAKFWSYRETFFSLVEATRQWKPWPAWQVGNESETNVTRDQCEYDQEELETASCDRASQVLTVNAWFKKEWDRLVTIYEKSVKLILEKAENRKKEWYGVKIVECLLHRIHDHTTSNEPCDEDFADEKTDSEIESCHKESHDTFHLDITPEPVPPMPEPFCLDPHPCTEDWMIGDYAFGYRHTDFDSDGVDDLCRVLKSCSPCVFTLDVPEKGTCQGLPPPIGQL